jgi:hypothetical protein
MLKFAVSVQATPESRRLATMADSSGLFPYGGEFRRTSANVTLTQFGTEWMNLRTSALNRSGASISPS